jgi:hypothetical protein
MDAGSSILRPFFGISGYKYTNGTQPWRTEHRYGSILKVLKFTDSNTGMKTLI